MDPFKDMGQSLRHLFLVRGLPGSGKSTFAGAIAGQIVEADDFFYDKDGYQFRPEDLPKAHALCQTRALAWIRDGVGDLAVANTFSCRWELEPYLRMAKEKVTTVVVVDIFDGGLTDGELAARNVHGVPEAGIAGMRARWEHNWREGNPLPPWERK